MDATAESVSRDFRHCDETSAPGDDQPVTMTLTGPPTSLPSRAAALRVGILAPPWLPVPPPAYGGTENVLDTLARGLTQAGAEVLLYSTGDATCPVDRAWSFERAVGVGGGGPLEELRQVIDAYRTFHDAGVEVVHDHTLAGPLYAGWFPDLPVVTTNHGPFDHHLATLYRAVSARVPVIAISAHQASTAPAGTVSAVIHHGIDTDQVPVGAGEGGYALFLGRMHPDKGVDLAIVAARAAGMPLRIAAKMREPHEREYFEATVAPLLGNGVEYLGEVSGADKLELLGSAACLLNPIRWAEPFGMVMIESLACGTPVVATRSGSVPEIVIDGETGFVCSNPADLAGALRRVSDLERRRCRAAAEARFSASRLAADHLRVYRAAIGAGRRVPALGVLGAASGAAEPAAVAGYDHSRAGSAA